MTIPKERYNALKWAREFLYSLLIPKETPRVPRAIRRQARAVLKHYPGEWQLEKIREKAKKELGE